MTRVDFVLAGYDTGVHGLPDELLADRTTYHRLAIHQIPPAPARDGFDTAVQEANPASHQGYELIAAGRLPISGPVDGDQLVDAVRTDTSAASAACRATTPAARSQRRCYGLRDLSPGP